MKEVDGLHERVTTPTGIKWINSAGKWADKKIQAFPSSEIHDFTIRKVRVNDCVIDPRRIIGTTYGDFHGMSWRQSLGEKRMSLKLDVLESRPEYYSDPKRYKTDDEPWALYEVNGDLYPISGTHRSIVAKFRGHEEGRTSQIVWWVEKLTVSERLKGEYEELNKILLPGEKIFCLKRMELPKTEENITEYVPYVRFRLHSWSGGKTYNLPVEKAVSFVKGHNRLSRAIHSIFPSLWMKAFG